MTIRTPLPPPDIPGLSPIEHIGSGGYADVYLYQQEMPNRRVAVKVLLAGDVATSTFTDEANLMARVSAHPYIVGIYEAKVAADGRPYLVMEYYPGDNYVERVRRERFSVADAIRVGIQVGSALETAHRAGILHRDVKPANILTSEYGRPGLTDFGIAAAEGRDDEADGVSIPWSPPEALTSASADVRSDVYSLSATIYHLLAGRSPFEIPGGRNGQLDLMTRLQRDPVPPVGRGDVPLSLERLLAQAMAKDPAHRPSSVAEFARSLQAVENELRLSMTPLELPDTDRKARKRIDDDDDATRVRGVTEVTAQPVIEPERSGELIAGIPAAAAAAGAASEVTATDRPERARQGMLAEPVVADTVHRQHIAESRSDQPPPRDSRNLAVLASGIGAVVVVVILSLVLFGGGGEDESSTTTVLSITGDETPEFLQPVDELDGEVIGGNVRFTWVPIDPQEGDEYVFTRQSGDRSFTGRTGQTEVTFTDTESGVEECISLVVTRPRFSDSATSRACVTP